jgi:hypothetical protein
MIKKGKGYTSISDFSSKLICEKCGGFYGPKIFHSNEKYRKTVYQCNKKYSGKKICDNPFVTEQEIKSKFIKAYDQYLGDRSRIIEDAQLMASVVTTDDTTHKLKKYHSVPVVIIRNYRVDFALVYLDRNKE